MELSVLMMVIVWTLHTSVLTISEQVIHAPSNVNPVSLFVEMAYWKATKSVMTATPSQEMTVIHSVS
jgi:hypothetical protein